MGRYTGPVCRQCRREGRKLFLKGARCYMAKCPIEQGTGAPGMHVGRRAKKMSEYGTQLRQKQALRRQYGMAAYLSGWNCVCNYAHHYGPYNDASSPYKPMVFAYGCGNGVIDTLQWEGFREGIDDIRYATLMIRLAREAAESEDLQTRYTGKLALQYLAEFKRDEEDLDMCRMEMVNFIMRLREKLGK